MRFQVTSIEGYLRIGPTSPRARPGISYHVVDVPFARRVMGSFRSEGFVGRRDRRGGSASNEERRAEAERRAYALRDELEARYGG